MINDLQTTIEWTHALVGDLLKLPAEQTWVEFKENNADPEMLGKLISALSNAARLVDRPFAYVLWGVRDGDNEAVGTTFKPSEQKKGNQPLEFWLAQHLAPDVDCRFEEVRYSEKRLVLLTIPSASISPVEFSGTAYLRIGSATPKLSTYPERQRTLWDKIRPYAWETGIAAQFLTDDDVLTRLRHRDYFRLTGQPQPQNSQGVLETLKAERLIQQDVGGRWSITNLGAILFAGSLSDFSSSLGRKAIRFAVYQGSDRIGGVDRWDGRRGYAADYEDLVTHISGLLPVNEQIGEALRVDLPLYPVSAIRELIVNALIHQDLTITGAGPMVELFSDRLEITNPGAPLVEPERILDAPPRSRNEALASLMRRMGMCEERGTGIDKVIGAVEFHQLPPPDFQAMQDSFRVFLFAPRSFARMTSEERIRACYQHAGLQYVSGAKMKNVTLRRRFGLDHASQVSPVIRKTVERGLIRPADPEHPRTAYVPFWA